MRTATLLLTAALGTVGALASGAPALAQRAQPPGSLYFESGGNRYDWKAGPDLGASGSAGSTWLLSATHEDGRVERVASGLTRRRCLALARVQFRPVDSCQYFGGRGGFETCDRNLVKQASCSPS